MEDNTLVKSTFSATINARIEKVDIPSWCFTLPESEYQSCSPAHCSAGATTAPDGRRMSINVEIPGGSLMVQALHRETMTTQISRSINNKIQNYSEGGHHDPNQCYTTRQQADS